MSDITKETVAAARAARELGYVKRTAGAASMSAGDCIENEHFDTLAELSRQQRDLLKRHRSLLRCFHEHEHDDCLECGLIHETDTLLALWPREGDTEEARDHDGDGSISKGRDYD